MKLHFNIFRANKNSNLLHWFMFSPGKIEVDLHLKDV